MPQYPPSEAEQYDHELRATILALAIQAAKTNGDWAEQDIADRVIYLADRFVLFVRSRTQNDDDPAPH